MVSGNVKTAVRVTMVIIIMVAIIMEAKTHCLRVILTKAIKIAPLLKEGARLALDLAAGRKALGDKRPYMMKVKAERMDHSEFIY